MGRKAIIFDMDGTLVDSDPIHVRVFIDFVARRGVEIDESDYMARIHGRRNIEIFGDLLPAEDPHLMDLAKETAFRERLAEVGLSPLPGLTALLDCFDRHGLTAGVATNAPHANLNAVLDATGLSARFRHKASADDVIHGKPHPQIYLDTLTALGAAPDEALVFEDSPSGIQAARAAGIEVIGLATSLSAETLVGHGATFAVTDFTDPAIYRHLSLPEGATT